MSDQKKSAKRTSRRETARPEMAPFETIRKLLGSIPRLPDEFLNEFDRFWEFTRERMQPEDPIEEILVRDLAESYFELRRIKKFKLAFLADKESEGMERLLTGRLADAKLHALRWRAEEDESFKVVNQVLNDHQLTRGDAHAIAMSMHMPMIETFDHRIAVAQDKLSAVIRQMDLRRAELALRARNLPEDPEDDALPVPEPVA